MIKIIRIRETIHLGAPLFQFMYQDNGSPALLNSTAETVQLAVVEMRQLGYVFNDDTPFTNDTVTNPARGEDGVVDHRRQFVYNHASDTVVEITP